MDGVSETLRRSIIDKSIEMGYGGVAMPDGYENACIAVIIPGYLHGDVFFYSEVIWTIDNEAKANEASAVHIEITRGMELAGELPVMPRGMRVLGILVVGVFERAYVGKLMEMGLPMLSVDIMYDGLPCVCSSNLMGGSLATRRLIELGHKDIGFIGPIFSASSIYERWCGFNLAMRIAGLAHDNKWNILGEQVFKLFDTEEVLEPYVRAIEIYPTAWFCAGDRIAIAMIHLLARYGVKVPDDVSIIGFDDILAAQMVIPQLTTVKTDRTLMGRLAVQYFFNFKANKVLSRVSQMVPFDLVERASVSGPAKGRL